MILPFLADAPPARDYLATQPTWDGPHHACRAPGFAGYHPKAVLQAPGLLDHFNDPRVTEKIEAFLGAVPCLYSVNAWWSLADGNGPHVWHVQHFHRDTDAKRFICLFTYLTDVDAMSGPFQVIEGSEENPQGKAGAEWDAELERDATITTVTGPAGTSILVNTLALHRGAKPIDRPRLMSWARYGLGPNSNSDENFMKPVPVSDLPTRMTGTDREREINRLLVAF